MPGSDPYRGELEAALHRNEQLSRENAQLLAELDAAKVPRRNKTYRASVFAALSVVCAAVAGLVALQPERTFRCGSQTSVARHDIQSLHQVSEMYRASNPGAPCPTVDELIKKRELSRTSSRVDPWGHPYKVFCGADETVTASAGPDGQPGTGDDLVYGLVP
jgi:hypothetical protein